MLTLDLSALEDVALADRLRALAGEERNVQADFLLHLDVLDRRRGFAALGYPSLWEFCLRALHLREGAAGRRIGAMRVLRRFPQLEDALRDGRLSLSTLCALGPAFSEENVADLTARAAFKSKAETEALVAAMRPRRAPADGLRRAVPPATATPPPVPPAALAVTALQEPPGPAAAAEASPLAPTRVGPTLASVPPPDRALPAHARPPELLAVAAEQWSLRVTLDAEAKRSLELLTDLLGHKIPRRDLAAVVKEALRCAVEKHGKRRGAFTPAQPRTAANSPGAGERTRFVPAAVRREVWNRDRGRCTFEAPDGTRCGSRWKLELDHVEPVALGGASTVANLRLRCRTHNLLHAEAVFGADHMTAARRRGERAASRT